MATVTVLVIGRGYDGWFAMKHDRTILNRQGRVATDTLGYKNHLVDRGNKSFVGTPDDWVCPCCLRTKVEIRRRDRDGLWMGALHRHHDHITDYVLHEYQFNYSGQKTDMGNISWDRYCKKISNFVVGFPPILICANCNSIDGSFKQYIGANMYFSFSYIDVKKMIIEAKPNQKLKYSKQIANSIYEERVIIFRRRMSIIDWCFDLISKDQFWDGLNFVETDDGT